MPGPGFVTLPTLQFFGAGLQTGAGLGANFGFGLQGGLNLPTYLPEGGWVAGAKTIIADVLTSVGYGDLEQGVFDRTEPGIPVVLHPDVLTRSPTIPDESPEFIGIYGPRPPTDWDEVYRQYEILNPPEEEVSHDWGHLIRQGIETFTGIGVPQVQQLVGGPTAGGTIVGPASTLQTQSFVGGGGGAPPMATNALCPPSGSCGPRYLTYDCKTGQMSLRRRRRRRRLLTEGDKQDLGVIVAMFGKGAAAQIALAAAVKR